MGNWGNTLDRWYNRGALVFWPTRLSFATRAEAAPSWALDALAARVRKGDLGAAWAEAATLAPFWDQAAARVEAKGLFTKALRTARLLDEPASATMLLTPFELEMLAPSHAKALGALVETYGERWTAERVQSWSTRRRYGPRAPGRRTWIGTLPQLTAALTESGEAGGRLHCCWLAFPLDGALDWLRRTIATAYVCRPGPHPPDLPGVIRRCRPSQIGRPRRAGVRWERP